MIELPALLLIKSENLNTLNFLRDTMLTLPLPVGNQDLIWLLLGMSFGRSFGKKMDYTIQESPWFKRQGTTTKWLVKSILDFSHHWWMGALIWNYAPLIVNKFFWPTLLPEVTWFGVGLFLDDIRDFKNVLNRYKKASNETPAPL